MGVDGEAMGDLLTWIFLDGLTIYRNLETYGTFLESVDRTLIHEMSVRACNSELGEVAVRNYLRFYRMRKDVK